MNTEKSIVRLTDEERQTLESIVKKLKGTSQKVKRAIVLLKADADGPNWSNEKIHDLTGLSLQSIGKIRKQLVLKGFDVTLNRKNDACHLFPKNLTDSRKHKSLQHVAAHRPRASGNGHSDSSPTKLLFWKSQILSAMKQFGKR